MKPPISYYGAKNNMLPHILPLIPNHKVYVEPFFGSGAVFWAKPKSKVEVINDINDNLINFYRVMKTDFEALQREIECTLHSRSQWDRAKEIYLNPDKYDAVIRAWAMWVQANMSFGNVTLGGWSFSKRNRRHGDGSNSEMIYKKDCFDEYKFRLKWASIECNDAIKVIETWDSEDTFFFFDSPYPESDCGHYNEHKEVYYRLLEALPTIKGKFLMSSYPSDELNAVREAMGLNTKDVVKALSVDGRRKETKTKTECLSWNYSEPQLKLF